MKKINLKYIGLSILVLISIPILIDWIIIGNDISSNINNSDWVSFLGSYLGSILGVLGVFLVTKMDQKEREKERKDSLFLNNISIYRNMLSLLNTRQLSSLQKEITEFKSRNDWNAIDSLTRQKLKNIEDDLYYTNEGIPEPLLNSVTVIIMNNLEIDLVYENSIYMKIPKTEMKKILRDDKYAKGYTNKEIDNIYRNICKIGYSDEWKEYLKKRSEVFKNISTLRKEIDARIEKVLTY